MDLETFKARHPQKWKEMQDEILHLLKTRDVDGIRRLATRAQQKQNSVEGKAQAMAWNQFCEALLRTHLEGDQALRFRNRFLSNRLFFSNGLFRKPVSLFWFNCIWPFVGQKARLLSLLNEKGIYAFYSKPFLRKVANLFKGKRCLEIAAGDGSLSYQLGQFGLMVQATDDYSWAQRIRIPAFVEELDAPSALNKYKPQVVFCAWPPAKNKFEKFVFETPSVQFYLVIGSQFDFASGNRKDYESQKNFRSVIVPRLTKLVLPPEAQNEVILFTRNNAKNLNPEADSIALV